MKELVGTMPISSKRDRFGRRIQALREAASLTQSELAGRAGISQSSIADYERGRSIPGLATASKIAQVLGITTDDLFGEKAVVDVLKYKELPSRYNRETLGYSKSFVWTDSKEYDEHFAELAQRFHASSAKVRESISPVSFSIALRVLWAAILRMDNSLPMPQRIDIIMEALTTPMLEAPSADRKSD